MTDAVKSVEQVSPICLTFEVCFCRAVFFLIVLLVLKPWHLELHSTVENNFLCSRDLGPLICYKEPCAMQIQSNALAALEALDAQVAEEVLAAGCITGDRINGLCDGETGKWWVLCSTSRENWASRLLSPLDYIRQE